MSYSDNDAVATQSAGAGNLQSLAEIVIKNVKKLVAAKGVLEIMGSMTMEFPGTVTFLYSAIKSYLSVRIYSQMKYMFIPNMPLEFLCKNNTKLTILARREGFRSKAWWSLLFVCMYC